MVARRYGIYLRVFTSISNERAQRTSEISNVYYIDQNAYNYLTIAC